MYSSIQHKSMESFCQRGTTDHVLPSTLTHDPVSWKRMSISHNLLTLIELIKHQQARTNPGNFYCNRTENTDMAKTVWWRAVWYSEAQTWYCLSFALRLWLLNWHFKAFLNREIESRQYATDSYLLHLNWIYYHYSLIC